MHEIILHHYPTSPFAEKARLMLGFKQLSWRSVAIPPVMPKPDLTALTGGYRRTPVLQIGPDVYCDTAVLFLHAVSLVFQPESMAVRFAQVPKEFVQVFSKDRTELFSSGSVTRIPLEQAKNHWPVLMARLQQQLARGNGEFLLGSAPCIADFAVAHCLWFLKGTPVTAPLVDDYPEVAAWLGKVLGVGHGSHSELSAEDALTCSREATPAPLPDEAFFEPNGFQAGQSVTVCAVDYGTDPVAGELVFAGVEEVILRREDERAGVVHVHFPRIGYRIEAN